MILSDIEIRRQVAKGALNIDPFESGCVQPSSVDVHLSGSFSVFRKTGHDIDPLALDADFMEAFDVDNGSYLRVEPGQFILGSTIEKFDIPNNMIAMLNGKSSLGRLGLLVHATAGFIDPGFSGDITLELSNINDKAIRLHPGMAIGQVSFLLMERDAQRPYGSLGLGSHYQHQSGPTASRYGSGLQG